MIRFGNGNNDLTVFNTNKIIESEQTWEQFLAMNNLHIIYKANVSEFVPLPQSEQNAIRALKSDYPTTVITTDGGEIDPDIEVTYIADTKNYIDQKIEATNKSVVATQKALL